MTKDIILVPSVNLFGTQKPDEYCHKKTVFVREQLSSFGIEYLKKNPIAVCILNTELLGTILAIIDGHHRTREAARLSLSKIPALVYTPQETALIFYHDSCSAEKLVSQIESWIAVALLEFNRQMGRHNKKYHPLPLTPELTREFGLVS